MNVGLVIVTHADVGESLLRQAEVMLGPFHAVVRVIGVLPADNPEQVLGNVHAAVESADQGLGVVLLADVFGATPSNIAHRLETPVPHRVIHGLNLAMLLRAHNYATLPLDSLVTKIIEGGRAAIFAGDPE